MITFIYVKFYDLYICTHTHNHFLLLLDMIWLLWLSHEKQKWIAVAENVTACLSASWTSHGFQSHFWKVRHHGVTKSCSTQTKWQPTTKGMKWLYILFRKDASFWEYAQCIWSTTCIKMGQTSFSGKGRMEIQFWTFLWGGEGKTIVLQLFNKVIMRLSSFTVVCNRLAEKKSKRE